MPTGQPGGARGYLQSTGMERQASMAMQAPRAGQSFGEYAICKLKGQAAL